MRHVHIIHHDLRPLLLFLAALPLTVGLTAALTACGDMGTLDEVDPEAAPAEPTWDEHVAPIIDARCSTCHSESAQFGPAEGYILETCAQTKRQWRSIRETAFESKTMPPGAAPRMTSSELLTLQRWHDQGAVCP